MGIFFLPRQVYLTQKKFDDTDAADMKCGDLSEASLRSMGVVAISTRINPFTLTQYPRPVRLPARGYNPYGTILPGSQPEGTSTTQAECSQILFDEMRELSTLFASGRYANLITQMITHFQDMNGASFRSLSLDDAYESLIWEQRHENPLGAIRNVVNEYLSKSRTIRDGDFFANDVRNAISQTKLPKFNRFSDNFNGLGITVHDIHAQEITILSLDTTRSGWRATISFKAQDHFGLDNSDISQNLYRQFRFFRIWFLLQRYEKFAFKPFMTNFSAHVESEG
ncbi:DUF3289 family protein [Erwiniaceae bacterium BAC15a-03b]|uniref:DUF3289 family protein n=1 Tax=Winslowiella arboricola TaxID=2978220 RepID=A0A9J6PTC5_9GAMM|nr:DUF3289 family protein [Winslowiella arboricola]MCU5773978.1 DUF3289 family protein [Winslowiella arboricola]MCU5777295.1 DUF3289 family protein [Winslowiella arboricola]